jgi:ATP-dependent helicase/nuclease subunit A
MGCRWRGLTGCGLAAPLAVRDLMAALRFAAQPLDDLNLACLLVSPLIGWSQDDLLRHGLPREGVCAVGRTCAAAIRGARG